MITWLELKALGGLILLVSAVDSIAFTVLVVRAIAE
jgi:hypothetical protein